MVGVSPDEKYQSARISVQGVSKRFGSTLALDRVELEINDGERVVLFGPNGAGKTTLLRVIAGLHRPDAGSVEIDGSPPRSHRGRIGYLGHEPHLYPHLTVRENLLFFARLYDVGASGVTPLMERVGITRQSDALVHSLSRGELQRASIAKTLLADPDIVLADEPFTALDEEAASALPELLFREGRTLVVATHDRAGGEALASRTVRLEGGRVGGAK